jgi:hypothetical protein
MQVSRRPQAAAVPGAAPAASLTAPDPGRSHRIEHGVAPTSHAAHERTAYERASDHEGQVVTVATTLTGSSCHRGRMALAFEAHPRFAVSATQPRVLAVRARHAGLAGRRRAHRSRYPAPCDSPPAMFVDAQVLRGYAADLFTAMEYFITHLRTQQSECA